MSSGGPLDAMFRDAGRVLAFAGFGESVTHRTKKAPGVTPVSTAITAVRVRTPDTVEKDFNERTKWVVAAADLAEDPRSGDTITDDASVVWGVIRVTPQEGGVFELTCIHSQEV
jgi:hypothetical protein